MPHYTFNDNLIELANILNPGDKVSGLSLGELYVLLKLIRIKNNTVDFSKWYESDSWCISILGDIKK